MRSVPGPRGGAVASLATADAVAAAPSMVPKTTTGETLRILRALLLIVTVMVGGTSWRVFHTVHSTVEMVHSTTAPAILDVLAARQGDAQSHLPSSRVV